MLQTFLILLAVSFDVFTYAVSMGALGLRFNLRQILGFLFISGLVFVLALIASKGINLLMSEEQGYVINGVALILFGVYYLFDYVIGLNLKLLKNLKFATIKQRLAFLTANYSNKPVIGQKRAKFSVWQAVPVNLDAFFTATFAGNGFYSLEFCLVCYFALTLLAVVIGNKLSFSVLKRTKIDYSWVCGVIFVWLGVIKLLGK